MDPKVEIMLSILAYSFCSGTMLLLNKMTLHYLPYPSMVTTFQLVAAVAFIVTAKVTTPLKVDPIRWKFVIPYCYYIVAFALGVYCNMKSLSLSNVETVIVFKALSPCLVSIADALFLGREFPSFRSWSALGLIVLGSLGYASQDEKFQTQGISAYTWPFFYLVMISFEMAYGKSLLKSVDLQTLSGPVLYTNLLGIPPMLLFAMLGQEYHKFMTTHVTGSDNQPVVPIGGTACLLLLLSCAAGTGIGYAGWWCRGTVSATSFSLIGVMNKCLTILLNIMVWDQHATPWGIASLMLCLMGGSLYRQSPLRPTDSTTKTAKTAVALDHASAFDHGSTTTVATNNNNNSTSADHSNPMNGEDDLETALLLEERKGSDSPPFAAKRRSQ
ncbi:hypothetical protein ACA910_018790 [Epithemia clementina (nom. ined.)]